jgi:hypothetical protein
VKSLAGCWQLASLLVLASLAVPATAGAATYCVHQGGGCSAGQTDEGANLQKALDEAGSSSGNTVVIGAGTYTHEHGFSFNHGSPGPDVTISGAGAGQTILASSNGKPAPGYVLSFGASAASTLAGLTIHVQNGDGGGLAVSTATANGIAVATDDGGAGGQIALSPSSGATVEHSTIQGETDTGCCPGAVFDNSAGEVTLLDDTLIGFYGLDIASPSAEVTARDLRVQARAAALVTGGSATIDDMLAVLNTGSLFAGLEAYQGGVLTVRSATVIGSGAAPESKGLMVYGAGAASKLTVEDSIVRGFPLAWERLINGSGGTASLTLENDDLGAGANNASGSPSQAANIDADPLFVNPAVGDYHLRFGSPAIDSGGTCASVCKAVPDLDGLTRPIDGNGDGNAVRDMGAYEYGHRAPTVSATASEPKPLAKAADTFVATASDPDPGDVVSLSWAFDDGATAGGASVVHAFVTPGAHTAKVTATDSSGLSATATVTVDVPGKPNTKIKKAKIVAGKDEAIFHFKAEGVASGFQCELRRSHSGSKPKFRTCRSPKTYKHLKPGRYTFEVRGFNPAGNDPTPAKREFSLR